jgi:uncharacterized protein YjdB
MALYASLASAAAVGCGGDDDSPTLESIQVTTTSGAHTTIPMGVEYSLVATGLYSDKSTRDLSGEVTWTSSDPAILEVDATGKVKPARPGKARVTAAVDRLAGTFDLEVTAAALKALTISAAPQIKVESARLHLATGSTAQLLAQGEYTDGTTMPLTEQVTWSVSDERIASFVMDRKGLLRSTRAGEVKVVAALGETSAETVVVVTTATLREVKIGGLQGPETTYPVGVSIQLEALGVYSDDSEQPLPSDIRWQLSDTLEQVAATGHTIELRGKAAGEARVTLEYTASGETRTAGAVLQISDAAPRSIEVVKQTPTGLIAVGTTVELLAQVRFDNGQLGATAAHFASSDESILRVLHAEGGEARLLATGPGRASITVTASGDSFPGLASASYPVEVHGGRLLGLLPAEQTAHRITLQVGETHTLSVRGQFESDHVQDVSADVNWSEPAAGSPVTLDRTTHTLTATAAGFVTLHGELLGKPIDIDVEIIAPRLERIELSFDGGNTIPAGFTAKLRARAVYSNNTRADAFSMSDTRITIGAGDNRARLLGRGGPAGDRFMRLKTRSAGDAAITVSLDGVEATIRLGITEPVLQSIVRIESESGSHQIPAGTDRQLRAIGRFSDGSTRDITSDVVWNDASEAVTVGNGSGEGQTAGLVTVAPTAPESAFQVTATYARENTEALSASIDLAIVAPTVRSIEIRGPDRLAKGTKIALRAIAVYSNGETRNVSDTATWESSSPPVATVAGRAGTEPHALVDGIETGATEIRIRFAGYSDTASLVVTAAELRTIELHLVDVSMNGDQRGCAAEARALNAAIPVGHSACVRAIGRFSDDSIQDITDYVTFTSQAAARVTVSHVATSQGLVTGLEPGRTSISAVYPGHDRVRGEIVVEVGRRVLDAVEVELATETTLQSGTRVQLRAIARYSDGATDDVTDQASWATEGNAASVSNVSGSKGLLLAEEPGEVTIAVTYQDRSGQLVLQIQP